MKSMISFCLYEKDENYENDETYEDYEQCIFCFCLYKGRIAETEICMYPIHTFFKFSHE